MAKAGGGGGRGGGGGGGKAATLTGSPKQVSWAGNIRRTVLSRMSSAERYELGKTDGRAAKRRVRAKHAEKRARLNKITTASWWINNRPRPGHPWRF